MKFGGRYLLFFEEFMRVHGRGRISVVEIRNDLSHSRPVTVLEQDYHLSYPFVFQSNGEYYMIPETRQSGRVELYKAERFPYDWRLSDVLLDGIHAVDSTLIEIDDTWWLFANVSAKESRSVDELHVFYANRLAGPWKAHPMNPVKLDVRSSR